MIGHSCRVRNLFLILKTSAAISSQLFLHTIGERNTNKVAIHQNEQNLERVSTLIRVSI